MPISEIKEIQLETHEDVYEQLFIHYLDEKCKRNDAEMCKPYLTSTIPSTAATTTAGVEAKTMSYKLFIYGGIAAAVLLVCFCFILILVVVRTDNDKKAAQEAKQQANLEAQMKTKKKKKRKKRGGRTSGTSRHGTTTSRHKKRRKHKTRRSRTSGTGTTRKSTRTGSGY
ncbi:hypothetical protein CAEBREN_22682 [Caenorhabditis brenneri]|uniref:Uncharacterized protein n=1 Tax=Caenorhabditis brenneri TaxID=135651 RepID=G0NBW8_CAEBE|nr:hypothetical protein CAEBREN_22682 [Caenorhabditis brenneri]